MNYGFHPEARLEYREAAVFYEARQPGLGAAFTREIEAAIDRILETPELFRFVEQDVRRCLAHTFPHGVLYTVEGDFILSWLWRTAVGSQATGTSAYLQANQTANQSLNQRRAATMRSNRTARSAPFFIQIKLESREACRTLSGASGSRKLG